MTTKTQVMALLKTHRNERGIQNWKKMGARTRLKSFGIGLTQLRKLAKQVGKDRKLARLLWRSDVYDAKVIGLLIDDPKQISREQAEEQVDQLDSGMLEHVFTTCGSTLAKASCAFELADDWIENKDIVRRRCGYALIYELSKKNIAGMDDAWFMDCIASIEDSIDDEQPSVRSAMGGALLGIGKRNKRLNKAAARVAKSIGPIEYEGDNNCEPFDVYKHLTSDYMKQKFAK